MLFAEASHASHSALQVSKEVKMMIDTFGQKCSGLSAKSDLDGLLVRMLADSSAWHSKMCHLTWSVKGMKSGRLLFQLVPKTLTTGEIESGLWPTPDANMGARGAGKCELKNGRFVRTSDTTGTEFGASLNAAVNHKMLSQRVSKELGRLNPDWVEPLMGYPVGWTDLKKDDVTHEITEFVGNPDDSGEPRVTTRADLRAKRLKQLGNSIVPQVASEIFKAIREANEKTI